MFDFLLVERVPVFLTLNSLGIVLYIPSRDPFSFAWPLQKVATGRTNLRICKVSHFPLKEPCLPAFFRRAREGRYSFRT